MRQILCVDDHADSRELIKFVLESEISNAQVDCAEDAAAAVRLASVNDYDLCILDFGLPETNGAELCSWIKSSGAAAEVIFLSGSATRSDRQKALDAGGAEFLLKPYDPYQLAKVAESYLASVDAGRQMLRAA